MRPAVAVRVEGRTGGEPAAMSSDLIWPLICLIVGLILLVAEVFVPSGGLIGLLAIGLLIVSLGLAFASSMNRGLAFLVALLLLMPVTLAYAVYLWPRTPMAKWVFLRPPDPEEVDPEDRDRRPEHLIGQFGRALTPLRPSGLVDFEGRKFDGLADEGMIPAGALIRAVQIRGTQLVVRTAPDEALDQILG